MKRVVLDFHERQEEEDYQGLSQSYILHMVPTYTGKPGNWENFFQSGKSQGILSRLEKSGNFTQNTRKVREF